MENPIKMDDLGVSLFSETSTNWIFGSFFFQGFAVGETWGYFTNLCNTFSRAYWGWSLADGFRVLICFFGKTSEWRDNQTFKQETCQKIVHKCWIFHCHGSCQRVNHCISMYIYISKCIYTYAPYIIDAPHNPNEWINSGGERTFGLATFFGATLLLSFWRLESTGATGGAKMVMMEMGGRLVYTPWRF